MARPSSGSPRRMKKTYQGRLHELGEWNHQMPTTNGVRDGTVEFWLHPHARCQVNDSSQWDPFQQRKRAE